MIGSAVNASKWIAPTAAVEMLQRGCGLSAMDAKLRLLRLGKYGEIPICVGRVVGQVDETRCSSEGAVEARQDLDAAIAAQASFRAQCERVRVERRDMRLGEDFWTRQGVEDEPLADWWDTGELELVDRYTGERALLMNIRLAEAAILHLLPEPPGDVEETHLASPCVAQPTSSISKLKNKGGRPRSGQGTWRTPLMGDLLAEVYAGDWKPGGENGCGASGKNEVRRRILDWFTTASIEEPAASTISDLAEEILSIVKTMRKADDN